MQTLQFSVCHDSYIEVTFGLLFCRSSGKVYHVLIFHKGGQYSLDIAGEGGSLKPFPSLDDLVVFCMSHQMKMEGDEVSDKQEIHNLVM